MPALPTAEPEAPLAVFDIEQLVLPSEFEAGELPKQSADEPDRLCKFIEDAPRNPQSATNVLLSKRVPCFEDLLPAWPKDNCPMLFTVLIAYMGRME